MLALLLCSAASAHLLHHHDDDDDAHHSWANVVVFVLIVLCVLCLIGAAIGYWPRERWRVTKTTTDDKGATNTVVIDTEELQPGRAQMRDFSGAPHQAGLYTPALAAGAKLAIPWNQVHRVLPRMTPP